MTKRMSGLSALLILVAFHLVSAPAEAAVDGIILRVTSRLKMTSQEPDAPKQFFIDVGKNRGIKPGDVFTVYRTIPVVDNLIGEHKDFFKVALGELQIQAVGEYSSFGQISQRIEAKDLPTMDSPWFMIGDTVQLKSSLPFQQ